MFETSDGARSNKVFPHISDKEERALYEMLHSLTTNLEVLDSVREVFEHEDLEEQPEPT